MDVYCSLIIFYYDTGYDTRSLLHVCLSAVYLKYIYSMFSATCGRIASDFIVAKYIYCLWCNYIWIKDSIFAFLGARGLFSFI